MVTLTKDAIEFIDRFIDDSEPMDWLLVISWKQGGGDNRRTSDGDVMWERLPHEGWIVDLGGFKLNRLPSDVGTPIHREVRLLIQDQIPAPGPFPGGEVYADTDGLKVRPHAI
jgi:hypothetical protein